MITNKTIGVVFTCIDPRLWQKDVEHLENARKILGVDLVDPLTEPGVDGVLANGDCLAKEALKERFQKASKLHNPVAVCIIGHCNCGGNSVSDKQHEEDVRKSVETIRSWGFTGSIIGALALHETDEKWPLRILT